MLMDALEKEGPDYLMKPWIPSRNSPSCPAIGLNGMPDVFWIRCCETIVASYQEDGKGKAPWSVKNLEKLLSRPHYFHG